MQNQSQDSSILKMQNKTKKQRLSNHIYHALFITTVLFLFQNIFIYDKQTSHDEKLSIKTISEEKEEEKTHI